MKKARLSICVYILILSLLLTSCSGPMQESSALHVPEASEVESMSISLDIEAEIRQQIDEIKNEVKNLIPTVGVGEFDWDEALAVQAQTAIASLGYPVQIHQKDMPNYERVTDFFDKIKAGESAFVAVYSVRAYGGQLLVWGYVFEKNNEGFSKRHIDIDGEVALSERYPLKDIVLTEHGNLIAYEADESGDLASGFRVLPLPVEYREAYDKYVRLVDVQSDGVISQTWGQDFGFRNLPWEYVFEEIWEQENDRRLLGEGSPYYHGNTAEPESGDAAIVPAAVVEETLQKYFNVQVEILRKMDSQLREGNEAILYNPEDNTYRIWGFRGGGYKPTVEVWGVKNNLDGSVSLDLAHIALDFGNDGNLHSTLTVMPQPDGGFRYISNIFSEDIVKERVEKTLELAESADFLYQGGLTTIGDSVEKNGYHYAAIDKQDQGYQDKVILGGLSSVEGLEEWFRLIFEKEAAEKYIQQMLDVPLYIDGTKDGEDALFVNQDVKGDPIAQGHWTMEDFVVLENTPDSIIVQMRLDMTDGSKTGTLTLVPGERRNWILTDSFEGTPYDPYYDFVPGPGHDAYYLEVVSAKDAILETVRERVEAYRNGTLPNNLNHHPPYPADFPPVSELHQVLSVRDFAIRFAGNPDALGSVYIAVPIGDDGEYELHMTVSLVDIDGKVQWGSGNTFFKRVSKIKWHQQDVDLYH